MATVNGDLYDSIVTDNERVSTRDRGGRVRMFTDSFTCASDATFGDPETGDRILLGWLPKGARVIGIVLVNTDTIISTSSTLQFGDEDSTFNASGAPTNTFGSIVTATGAYAQRVPVSTFGSHLVTTLFGVSNVTPTSKIKQNDGPLHLHFAIAGSDTAFDAKTFEVTVFYVSD